jgi:lipopolysaccharide/colanic/teichoic acid biosynthesis glycosyltransferase
MIERCESTSSDSNSDAKGQRAVNERTSLAEMRVALFTLHDQGLGYKIAIGVLDFAVALFVLVLLFPVMVIIAIIIKWESPGPILFRHTRVGINRRRGNAPHRGSERRKTEHVGKPFTLYKFRTMYADARERFPELYAYNYSEEELHTLPIKILVGKKRDPNEFDGPAKVNGHFADDPRITPFGCWLRKTSLDELPNVINVLKGDMHLVGPRPDIVENIAYYSKAHLKKFDVKPGITGLAQIKGRGMLTFQQTNDCDVEYVNSRSLFLDLKILTKTISAVLKSDGAF